MFIYNFYENYIDINDVYFYMEASMFVFMQTLIFLKIYFYTRSRDIIIV